MPGRPRVVLDASVVVKWFTDETNTKAALRFQGEISRGEVLAFEPDLVYYEVANALVRGVRAPAEHVASALRILSDVPWEVSGPTPTLLEDAVSLSSNRAGLTVYDAVYVALAPRREAELVTADGELHRIIGSPITRLL